MDQNHKTYCGIRDSSGTGLVFIDRPGERLRKLPPRLDLYNHSPTGLEWGYGGSGPAQLALALLADALGDDREALHLYQSFKWAVIARLDQKAPWTMTEDAVRRHAGALRRVREMEE